MSGPVTVLMRHRFRHQRSWRPSSPAGPFPSAAAARRWVALRTPGLALGRLFVGYRCEHQLVPAQEGR